MSNVLVSAHNPMTGPRHLGHFVSTIREWRQLQDRYDCFIIIDDLVATFMNPAERDKLLNRTLFTARDFLAGGVDRNRVTFVLTSLMPESLELMTLLSSFVEVDYCKRLYDQSYCGQLKTYHRSQLGLNKYPSIAEFVYPQLAVPALTLGLNARFFQGGEEVVGYTYIMEEIVSELTRKLGPIFQSPAYLAPNNDFVLGVDGTHMISANAINLAAPPDEIKEQVEKVTDHEVLAHWCHVLGEKAPKSFSGAQLSADAKADMVSLLTERLKPFRTFRITNGELLEILQRGSRKAGELLHNSTEKLKEAMRLPAESAFVYEKVA